MAKISLPKPRARGLFVLTAHPEGCRVGASRQIERAKAAFSKPLAGAEGKTALVIGSTTFGYGSSTAIALREAGFSRVIGLGYETPPTFRNDKVAMAPPGWFLTHALHEHYGDSLTYFADGFANVTRDRVLADLAASGHKVDLLVYSVAAPRRTHLGEEWTSSLLVRGEPLDALALDYGSGELKPVTVDVANDLEVEHTRRVMGGDDLDLWVNALLHSGLAAEGFIATALSYIGPDFEPLRRIYWDGALGSAKQHVDATTRLLNARLSAQVGGRAFTVMNPAVVTGASVAIPAMLTYLASYLGVVDAGTGAYDDPLDVGIGFARALYGDGEPWRAQLDDERRLRLDQHELEADLQAAVQAQWNSVTPGPATGLVARGLELFKAEYMRLFGFEIDGVDYDAEYEFDLQLGEAQGVVNLIES